MSDVLDRTRSTGIDGSRIDAVLQAAVESGAVPHVAAIAADVNGVVYEGAAGVRTVGTDETPVDTSTQFSAVRGVEVRKEVQRHEVRQRPGQRCSSLWMAGDFQTRSSTPANGRSTARSHDLIAC